MTDQKVSARVFDDAAKWVARLRSDTVTDHDKEAFSGWFTASEEHRLAFDQTCYMWQDLMVIGDMPFDEFQSATRPAPWRQLFQWQPLGLAAAATLAGLALFAASIFYSATTYETTLGEQSTLMLTDGSVLTLNTLSRADVDFSAEKRKVELVNGEAFFEVKKDQERPFVVSACNATITAVGTAFNVQCDDGLLRVTVAEGAVRVRAAASNNMLTQADQLTMSDSAAPTVVQTVNTGNVTAWRQQLHIYDGVPLRAVIDDLNRYSAQKIRVFDQELAKIEVVARYKMTDRESTLNSLVKTFPLDAVVLADGDIALVPRL